MLVLPMTQTHKNFNRLQLLCSDQLTINNALSLIERLLNNWSNLKRLIYLPKKLDSTR
jgi:hypothetical protein